MSDGTNTHESAAPEATASDELERLNAGMEPDAGYDGSDEVLDTGEGTMTEEEFEEIERSGKRYKIPKDLKGEFLMQADYTRKTQDVAEHRKAIEAERAAIQERRALQEKHIDDIAQVKHLDRGLGEIEKRIEAYSKLDWARLEADDPFKAQSATRQLQQLQLQQQQMARHRHGLTAKIEKDISTAREETQRERAKRLQEGEAILARDIPGWGAEVATKLVAFARSEGLTDDDIRRLEDNPGVVKLLHKAWRGSQVAQQQQRAAQPPSPSADLKPVGTVARGRAAPSPTGLDDRLSPEEWARRRNEQLRKRNG